MHSTRLIVAALAASLATACASEIVDAPRSAATARASASGSGSGSSTGSAGPAADLQITGSSSIGSTPVNTNIAYTFRVRNVGPDSAVNVTFSDTLLGGSIATGAGADNGGTCAVTSNLVFCTLGTIRKGGQVTIFLDAAGFNPGPLPNRGNVTSAVPDPVPTNNLATVMVQILEAPTGGGNKVFPVVASAFSSLPAVFQGGAYNIAGLGDAPGFQFTATQSGTWQGVYASLHGDGLPGRGVCWMLADDPNNPDNPGLLLAMTASTAIPATGPALTFFPAPAGAISIVAGQKYWLFCRGLANQTWGGDWDFSTNSALRSLSAFGSGSFAFASPGTAPMPAFEITVLQP